MVNPLIGAKMEPLSCTLDLAAVGGPISSSPVGVGATAVTTTTAGGLVKLELDQEEKVEVKMEMLGDLFGDNFSCVNSLLSDITDPLSFSAAPTLTSSGGLIGGPGGHMTINSISPSSVSTAFSSLASSIVNGNAGVGTHTYSLADIAVAAAAQAAAATANQSSHEISGHGSGTTLIRTVKLPLSRDGAEVSDGNYPVLSIPATYATHSSAASPIMAASTTDLSAASAANSDSNSGNGGGLGGCLQICISPISHGGQADTTSLTSPCSTPTPSATPTTPITPNGSSSNTSSKKTIFTAKGRVLHISNVNPYSTKFVRKVNGLINPFFG